MIPRSLLFGSGLSESKKLTWTQLSECKINSPLPITINNYIFVVGEQGAATFSVDQGSSWQVRTKIPSTTQPTRLANNGVAVLVTLNNGIGPNGPPPEIYSTLNYGVTYTKVNTPIANNFSVRGIAFGNNMWIMLSHDGQVAKTTASNGDSGWQKLNNIPLTTVFDLIFQNGLFIAYGSSAAGNNIYSSSDGITWTNRSISGVANISNIVYFKGEYIATSNGQKVVHKSPNLMNWQSLTLDISSAPVKMTCNESGILIRGSGSLGVVYGNSIDGNLEEYSRANGSFHSSYSSISSILYYPPTKKFLVFDYYGSIYEANAV